MLYNNPALRSNHLASNHVSSITVGYDLCYLKIHSLWNQDGNDGGHEYSCTKVVIHGIKAVIHDVKAIAITHGVESIAHGVVEDIILFEESGNLNLAAASSIADFFVFTIDISGDVGVSCSADSMVLLVAVVVDPLSVDIIL
ncbi:7196_t:CDS:2 [Entrophospora sp. SA101]|nr:7196_t:CDS:2 [Entrophospora sp. SA101]